MNDLERAYRRALRRYPRGWRRHHEDALLGVLLDNAEAEGRTRMSRTDRRNLTAHAIRLRAAQTAPWVLYSVAGLVLLNTASLVLGGVTPDASLILHSPLLTPVPIGGSFTYAFSVETPGLLVYVVSAVVFITAVLAGTLLRRRAHGAGRR